MGGDIFAMPSSSILLLFSVAFGLTNAMPWAEPQKTVVYEADEWSPRPTAVPADPAKLFKRDSVDVNVCGWIGGVKSKSAVCSSGSSCIHDTIHGYVGCCTTDGPCTAGVYTTCVDMNSKGWMLNSGMQNNGIYTCTASSLCYRNTYPGGYYQYGCGGTGEAAEVATTYVGQPSDLRLQVVFTGVTFHPTSASSSSSPSSSTSSSSTSSSSSSISSSTSTISSSSSSSTSSSSTNLGAAAIGTATAAGAAGATPSTSPVPKKASTGAVAGGTAGAVAGVALLAALIFWLLRCRQRSKKNRRAGSFITHIPNSGNSRHPQGPFQRLPYSPEDYVSPMTGHPDNAPLTNLPLPINNNRAMFPIIEHHTDTHYYSPPPPPAPYYRPPPQPPIPRNNTMERVGGSGTEARDFATELNRNGSGSSSGDRRDEQSVPLFSEIDDFSRGWHNAVQAQREAERARERDMGDVYSPDGDATMGVAAVAEFRQASQSTMGKGRIVDREARSEAFRDRGRGEGTGIDKETWSPRLRTTKGRANISTNTLRTQETNTETSASASRNPFSSPEPGHDLLDTDTETDTDSETDSDGDPDTKKLVSPSPPQPRSPLREGGGNNAGKRVSFGLNNAIRDAIAQSAGGTMQRYALVDEVVGVSGERTRERGEEIPILHSPGQLRNSRQRKGS